MEQYIVDLDLPPEERWSSLIKIKKEVNELIQSYLQDFKEADIIFSGIEIYKETIISDIYLKEIEGIAAICDFSASEILTANLYYDLLKFYFGCTAFTVYNEGVMRHARNLDWHTDNNILSSYTKIFNFQRRGKTVFKTIGWPGFIGALSGVRPRAFSLTLNAVASQDEPQIATPISFLLRDVLENATSFQKAQSMLEQKPIISDCLILLSGTQKEEKIVLERTPIRCATRTSNEDHIIVTNDYKILDNEVTIESNMLRDTSFGRYTTTQELLREQVPYDTNSCIDILKNENVMMGITVQQMVFETNTGAITLIKT
ncbi:C45 family autoproteolytic acyltransferase/hydolase [Dokdonia pacifica]|uniref:Beta subunit of N-acylethanolamine-hydrolyzing acid amidase n=1 Tax=Dokdonia pacifica TaxID=1627892 RepID=A0A238WUD3_9FLAO|nr:C45 family autoproteolytic acyltransferase/hydolase [Dokdonia pacifica]SNR49259.1 beta subunit of N-acylethanolamine-hydrolyzing acid amidase [Dokdonia pacifica]